MEPMVTLVIMIVEDDKDCRELLALMIRKKFPDVTIYTAINGSDGMELFDKYNPDIVITDINMPEMGGVKMALKMREVRPGTKIIMITADTGKAAVEPFDKGPGYDHLVLKPVDYQKLFSAIELCIVEIRST